MIKWDKTQIVQFLGIYEGYDCLWDMKNLDYSNKRKRESNLQQLIGDLTKEGLVPKGIAVPDVKSKIKSIRDSFRQELLKKLRRQKSGAEIDDSYKPKLSWFENAEFLTDVMSTRQSTYLELEEDGDSYEVEIIENNETNDGNEIAEESFTLPLQEKEGRGTKRRMGPSSLESMNHALNNSNTFAENLKEDAFEKFGQYVAEQLRSLPVRESILLQQQINIAITKALLSTIPNPPRLKTVSRSPRFQPS